MSTCLELAYISISVIADACSARNDMHTNNLLRISLTVFEDVLYTPAPRQSLSKQRD